MKLILVRHGETDLNQQRRVQGISDHELNDYGRRQAEAVATTLREEEVEAIYTSPLKRAQETAEAINRFHSAPLVPMDGLKELDAGKLDGLTYEQMRDGYADFLRQWIKDASQIRLPGGESLSEVQDRAWACIDSIMKKRHQKTVVVVSHYFATLCIICKALGIGLSNFRRIRQEVAGISVLELDEREAKLVVLNDTCHLREVAQ